MTSLFALLVGIDDYRSPVRPLRGARADVESAAAYLRSQMAADAGWEPLILIDGQATRRAVIGAFRMHLGQARRGDTALFWFSGHGSLTPLPPELAHLEPTGTAQSLVCADSRHGRTPDLLDRELAVLIGEVAEVGAHVVVVLDCCHSESGTRAGRTAPDGGREASDPNVRCLPPADQPPDLTALLPSLGDGLSRDGVPAARPNHVALSACRTDQQAREFRVPGGHRGLFSHALLAELERRGPAASYRELIIGACNRIENRRQVRPQQPTLSPATSDLIDQPFLGGLLRAPASTLVMRHVRGQWEVDAGSCHGMATEADDPARIAVHGREPLLEADVTQVRTSWWTRPI